MIVSNIARDFFEGTITCESKVGGGAKFVLSPRIGLRLEGRGYLTFTNMTLSGICGGVGCSVSFSGGGILQFEMLSGVTFSF